MKIRRFVAKDMRTALTQIKEELGADAVIMSNKKIAEGVELMAAVDNNQDAKLPASAVKQQAAPAIAPIPPITQRAQSESPTSREIANDVVMLQQMKANRTARAAEPDADQAPADSLSALLNRQVQQTSVVATNGTPPMQTGEQSSIEQQFKNFTERLQQPQSSDNELAPIGAIGEQFAQPQIARTDNTAAQPEPINQAGSVQQADFDSMKQEMASIRQLLQHQVSGLMWQDMAQKDPSRAVLVAKLKHLGLTEQLSDQIAGYIPANLNEHDAWLHAINMLKQQINTTNNDIIHRGGVVALVGPTGVGKTTTIAKLAARFAQIHGAEHVALISTDTYRIGGFEQLSTYGRIIGCHVKQAKDAQELDLLIQQFSNKKLILVDTAGMGQRDMRLAEHLTTLISNTRVKIRNYLVLGANTQQRVMQENVERFKKIPLSGCVFTKLDESLSVGEIISTSIQNALPISYLTDGQRVPEDIKVANAEKLVTLADKLASKVTFMDPSASQSMPLASPVVI